MAASSEVISICRKSGKEMFKTRAAAEKILLKLRHRSHRQKGSIYYCKTCMAFHITHYDYDEQEDIDGMIFKKPPPKKILRSSRNAEKRKIFKPFNLQLHHIEFDMKKIQILQPGYSVKKVSTMLSLSAGLLKLYMGCWYNCTMVVMMEAEYQLRKSRLYARDIKKLHTLALESVRRFEADMRSPQDGDLEMFNVGSFNQSYREMFRKDITNDEYFEFWQGLGGETWSRYKNHIMSLAYKYRKYFERIGREDAAMLSLIMTANALLDFCCTGFDTVCQNEQKRLPIMNITMERLFLSLNPKPVQLSWNRMCQAIVGRFPEMSETEQRNIILGMDGISQYLIDPIAIKNIEIDTVNQYAEVFGSIAKRSKAVDSMTKLREEIRQEILNGINEKHKNQQYI